jgi:phage shock protein PspC (stress-responsive transcriptional regulator)
MTEDSTAAPPSRLPRVPGGRMLAGVCTGLGRYTGIDPVIFRVGFALLVIAGGQGILLYIAAALLMPADSVRMSLGEQVLRRRFDGETVLIILGLLLGLGVLISATGRGLSGDSLIVVTVFALVLLVAHTRDVNLIGVARSLPERLQGHPPESHVPPDTMDPNAAASVPSNAEDAAGPYAGPHTEGMIDLATLDTYRPGAPPPPPAPTMPIAPPAPRPPRPPRPRWVLTPVTMLLAMMAGAAVVPAVAGRSPNSIAQITMATGLAIVGLGLVVGSVFGRGRGLVACGTVLSLGLLATSLVALAPQNARFGDVAWRPVDATPSEQNYRMAMGDGTLDLTALRLRPGQRIRVNAEIVVGELRVTVPRTSRVEAHLNAKVGDVTVEKRVISGPNATLDEVLEPEGPAKNLPTIELYVRGKLGNVEVTRA